MMKIRSTGLTYHIYHYKGAPETHDRARSGSWMEDAFDSYRVHDGNYHTTVIIEPPQCTPGCVNALVGDAAAAAGWWSAGGVGIDT